MAQTSTPTYYTSSAESPVPGGLRPITVAFVKQYAHSYYTTPLGGMILN